MSIPNEYLDLTLREVLELKRTRVRAGESCAVKTVLEAIKALAGDIAARKARENADQREWLAREFDRLTTAPKMPRRKRQPRRK